MSDGSGFRLEPLEPEEAMPPVNDWHSFDATPWAHPWLTSANLSAMRDYSSKLLAEARAFSGSAYQGDDRFAFVGNIANNMYMRGMAIARDGFTPHIFGAAGDTFIFGDPRWEEFDGDVSGDVPLTDATAVLEGIVPQLPFERFGMSTDWPSLTADRLPPFARPRDFRRWAGYFVHLPALQRLQEFDAAFAVQSPYLAYLSGRPYLAGAMGGDIWLESSRADALGQMQRLAYRKARAILVSNPWTFAHTRRYRMANAIHLPYCIDERRYAPGPATFRDAWIEQTGGSFFVLSTARMDSNEKRSEIGIEGFAAFAKTHPGARLVMLNWGEKVAAMRARLAEHGVLEQTLLLPVAGKKRLIAYLRSADCLLDQFLLGYYGSTALEAAGCGLPVVMRVERRQYEALNDAGAPPFHHAATAEEVSAQLARLHDEPALRRKSAEEHRAWLLANHSGARWSDDYRALLRFAAAGRQFDFSSSPLAAETSREERQYHEDQLQKAPPFPHYFQPAENAAPKERAAHLKPVEPEPQWGVAPRHLAWLADFKRRHARAPRVLALGNIGNNAYRDGVVLRRHGIEWHALVHDYYHVMGCPEWEDGFFPGGAVNEFQPVWSQIDAGGFVRPRWFAQGRLDTCLDYLIDINEGGAHADALWRKLQSDCEALGATEPSTLYARRTTPVERRRAVQAIEAAFTAHFPERQDAFAPGEVERDLANTLSELGRFRRLFAHYDLVVAYGTLGFVPFMAGKAPYIAYEHGTIRSIPFEETPLGRTTAVAFACADAQLITNADNVLGAERLRLSNYTFTPHTTNEGRVNEAEVAAIRTSLEQEHQADFVIFHPARHHWEEQRHPSWEKGNDIFIRGFARFVKELRPNALAVFVDWGQKVAESKALLAELGVNDRVVWIEPQPAPVMRCYTAASDAVADQFHIGTWGGILPHAAFHARPTIIHVKAAVHEWALPEMPPALEASTPAAVFEVLKWLLDPATAAQIGAASRKWYDAYHSSSVVAGRFMDAMMSSLKPSAEMMARRTLMEVRHSRALEALQDADTLGQRLLGQQSKLVQPAPAPAPAAGRAKTSDSLEPGKWGVQPHHLSWLDEFRRKRGRNPKLLAIGNIANNAYLNAVALRAYGVDCDALVPDYYHIMGCPEWEAATFDGAAVDQFKPMWSSVEMGGYARPRWFANGRLDTCMDYLIDINEGGANAEALWKKMQRDAELNSQNDPSVVYFAPASEDDKRRAALRVQAALYACYPDRTDMFARGEVERHLVAFLYELGRLRRLFSHYDVVVGHATDAFMPLIAGKRPYIAYEHGTIRSLPFEDSFSGRLCAATYAFADAQLITNCDNVIAAEKLRLDNYHYVPHTTNEGPPDLGRVSEIRTCLQRERGADFVVFHPARHHWEEQRHPNWEKGNDIFIRGFARFVKEVRPGAVAVFVDWGQTVAQSKQLLAELGIADRVIWIAPQPAPVMRCYTLASDVVADQFHIGTWGAVVPHVLFNARPALIYVNPAIHAWALPEMPPLMQARTPEAVLEALTSATDPSVAADIGAAGRRWHDRYHSSSVVAGRFLDAIMSSLRPPPELLARRALMETRFSGALAALQEVSDNSVQLAKIEARTQLYRAIYSRARRAARIALDPAIRLGRFLRRRRSGV